MDIEKLPALITVKEFAELFRIHQRSAYRYIKKAGIPVIRGTANSIRIPKDRLIEWLKNNERVG